jgi:hypothetical protein
MKQTAADRPVHSYQRKAAIATGGIADYAGKVHVKPIKDFDLNRTIFNTLEGNLPRYVIQTRTSIDGISLNPPAKIYRPSARNFSSS